MQIKPIKKTFVSIIRFVMLQLLLISFSIGLVTADDTKTKKGIEFEKIKEYFESFDLKKHDDEFRGHTLEKHVAKSFDWLDGRLSGDRHMKFASAYTDIETANKVIKEIVLENEQKIKDWLEKDEEKKRLSLSKTFDKTIGAILKRGGKKTVDCNIGVIVLKRTDRHAKSFFIITSYPVSNKSEVDGERTKKTWKTKASDKYAMAFY
jgi:hypothetical protein